MINYVINAIEAYSDSAIPKIGVDITASDNGVFLLNRKLVLPLETIKANINLKDVSNSLLALIEKFAQEHAEMNMDNLEKIRANLEANKKALSEAQAFAELLSNAVVVEKPAVLITDKIQVEILPVRFIPVEAIVPTKEVLP